SAAFPTLVLVRTRPHHARGLRGERFGSRDRRARPVVVTQPLLDRGVDGVELRIAQREVGGGREGVGAVEDRSYALSAAADLPLSDAQLDTVDAAIEQRLRDDDWSGAAIAGAESLAAEATGVVGPGPDQNEGGEGGG